VWERGRAREIERERKKEREKERWIETDGENAPLRLHETEREITRGWTGE